MATMLFGVKLPNVITVIVSTKNVKIRIGRSAVVASTISLITPYTPRIAVPPVANPKTAKPVRSFPLMMEPNTVHKKSTKQYQPPNKRLGTRRIPKKMLNNETNFEGTFGRIRISFREILDDSSGVYGLLESVISVA